MADLAWRNAGKTSCGVTSRVKWPGRESRSAAITLRLSVGGELGWSPAFGDNGDLHIVRQPHNLLDEIATE